MEKFSPKNVEEFRARLLAKKYTLVDFSAAWCGPCKVLKPKLDQLAKKYADKDMQFLNIDVDDCLETAEEENIEAMPTILIYEGNTRAEVIVGANYEKIEQLLSKYITE